MSKGTNDTHRTIILENSVIKGYHAYQIKPPSTDPPTKLIVDREYTNISDKDACLVWLPELETFPRSLHDMVTDQQRQLKLSDVAGLPIGHAPRILASFFRTVLDNEGAIHAVCTGNPCPSFPPWPAPTEIGGGVVIPCKFFIVCNDKDLKHFVTQLEATLEKMSEGSVMKISVVQQ